MNFMEAMEHFKKGKKMITPNHKFPIFMMNLGSFHYKDEDGDIEDCSMVLEDILCTSWRIFEEKEAPKEKDLSFGDVLAGLKCDRRYTRACWRNHEVYIWYWPGECEIAGKSAPEIRVKTIQGYNAPWMPNHTELFANDWMLVK